MHDGLVESFYQRMTMTTFDISRYLILQQTKKIAKDGNLTALVCHHTY